ncbi:MAG: hypothetical protein KGI41_02405 [Patescibacteria group bacterium]|nr:hypothetical protein [Patescibacteria group bacterium]MDE1966066.1 hypothetical protein [Patescibacteria group bacterium]
MNKLLVTGQVPAYLVAKWEERWGVNPTVIAAKVFRNQRIVDRTNLIAFGITGAVLMLTILYGTAKLIWSHLSPDDVTYLMASDLAVVFICGSVGMTAMMRFKTLDFELFPREACGFDVLYSWFVSASGKTAEELAPQDGTRLRAIAKQILVDLALMVLKAEAKTRSADGSEPDTKLKEAEVACRRTFDKGLIEMQRLLPIDADKNVYYREARKQFAS